MVGRDEVSELAERALESQLRNSLFVIKYQVVATVFGAAASATAIQLFFNPRTRTYNKNNNKCCSAFDSESNGVVQSRKSTSSSHNPFDPSKRKGYLSWDDYFMAIAFLSAERSKDPNRQVGACLVSQDGIILGIGYNGFPRGCSDDKLPCYVCHAEVNAILNTNHASAAGQRLYVTMYPCNECAKIIIQSGVSEVIYFVEKRLSETPYIASCKLLSMAGVKNRIDQAAKFLPDKLTRMNSSEERDSIWSDYFGSGVREFNTRSTNSGSNIKLVSNHQVGTVLNCRLQQTAASYNLPPLPSPPLSNTTPTLLETSSSMKSNAL
ncbi:hypothetical protein LguiB_008038 [Lonicera macranthoides]